MGKRGPKPNLVRRRQAKKLREQGLTLSQIAERLGITSQGVHRLLGRRAPRPICCRKCGAVIVPIGSPGADVMRRRPVCLACLASMPDAGFGERLRALRLARGMMQSRLAMNAGVSLSTLRLYEQGLRDHPQWPMVLKLARFLGPALVGLKADCNAQK
jgi:transcriptional regulator with XRE-family HTH domain